MPASRTLSDTPALLLHHNALDWPVHAADNEILVNDYGEHTIWLRNSFCAVAYRAMKAGLSALRNATSKFTFFSQMLSTLLLSAEFTLLAACIGQPPEWILVRRNHGIALECTMSVAHRNLFQFSFNRSEHCRIVKYYIFEALSDLIKTRTLL